MKRKLDLGAFFALWQENGSGLMYTCQGPHRARQ